MSRAPLRALLAAVLAAVSTLAWSADRRAATDAPDPALVPSIAAPLAAPELRPGEEAAVPAAETASAPAALAAPVPAAARSEAIAAGPALPVEKGPAPASAAAQDPARGAPDAAVDDQGLRLFDGGVARSVAPASPAGLPVFDAVTARRLRSLSSLSEAEANDLVGWLRGVKIPLTGRLPYSEDTTFSLELELEANRQLSEADLRELLGQEGHLSDAQWARWRQERYLPRSVWEEAHAFVLDRIGAAMPAGWRVTAEGKDLGNLLEIRTSNRDGVYHENTERDWADLVAALERVQRAVPGGFYSVHLHVGRRSLPKKNSFRAGSYESLQIDEGRFAVVAVMFEGLWRPLMGHGPLSPPDLGVLPSADAIVRAIHGDDSQVKFGVSSHDNWISQSRYHPTIENKSITQLLSRKPGGVPHLDPATLRQDLWPAFALFDMLYRAQELPFATLGLPVAAGTAPPRKQLFHFLDLAYGDDVAGKAVALQRLAEAPEVPTKQRALPSNTLIRVHDMRKRYMGHGLSVVYGLHEAHGGWDEKLTEHLLEDRQALEELASDLIRAKVSEKEAVRLFPAEMSRPLERAMREHHARLAREAAAVTH